MPLTVNLEHARLSEDERRMLDAALGASRRFQEFGAGGSTLMAVRRRVRTIVTVDSSPDWVATVRAHPEIAARLADRTMSVLHADIGPVGAWGYPADKAQRHRWPAYIGVAWAEWHRRGETPDLVFVDGRFRIACCLSVVVATADLVALQRPTVLLHDVGDERPYYRDVLQFFDVVASTSSLYHLRIRRDVTLPEAVAALLARQFDER